MNAPQIDLLATAQPRSNRRSIETRGNRNLPKAAPLEVITPTYDELNPSRFVVNGYGCSIERVMAI